MANYPPMVPATAYANDQKRRAAEDTDAANRRAMRAQHTAGRLRHGTVTNEDAVAAQSATAFAMPGREPNYLPVLLDGDDASVRVYLGAQSGSLGTQFWPGDRVIVGRDDEGGYVVTQKRQPTRYLIEGLSSSVIRWYDTLWHEGSIYLNDDGWAVWQGLSANSVAITPSSVLFVLPPELIPKWLVGQPSTKRHRFNAMHGDTAQWIDIYADGRVLANVTYAAGATYLNWTGIMYPTASAPDMTLTVGAAGSSTTEPVWANGFNDYSLSSGADPTFTPTQYVFDKYGVMHVWMMCKNPASFPAANTPIIALGSNHSSEFQNHYPAYDSSAGFAYVGSDGGQAGHSANGLNYKAGGTASGWTVTSARIVQTGNNIAWYDTRGGNAWTRYVAGGATLFSPIQFGKMGQQVVCRGLMTGGTISTYWSPMPRGMRPAASYWLSTPASLAGLLFETASNGAKGRADIYHFGQAFAQQGSSTWFCADNIVFVPEW